MPVRLSPLPTAALVVTCVLALSACAQDPVTDSATAPTSELATTVAPAEPSPLATDVDPSTTASEAPTSPEAPASPTDADVKTVTVRVAGKVVTPKPHDVTVKVGEPVRLVITSREANELHVHGVDVSKDLPAGTPVTVDLQFPDPGAFEAETHHPGLLLLRFVVR